MFTCSDSLAGSSALPSVVGDVGAATATPASAVGVLPSFASGAPPPSSGPWRGVLENPHSS